MKLNEINIRDPFILPYEGKYYLYGSRVGTPTAKKTWGTQEGFDVYISEDMENWSEPKSVFEKGENFWAEEDFWAPEVHFYKNRFYMFATFKAEGKCRGTQILVADRPDTTFTPISEEPVTPKDWECLDGTLYIDKKGNPHIVFCHEWLQIGDGTVCEIELSKDLRRAVSAPRKLWSASDYKNVKSVISDKMAYVTDGPFLYRCENDELISLWSSFCEKGYAELIAKSDNGDIDGNWTICEHPLFEKDGGHGMLFENFEGDLCFIMHKPNVSTMERPVIKKLKASFENVSYFCLDEF